MMTVAFLTLGCKLNYAESATLARQFVQSGFSHVSASEPADVYVINTCSVTEHADKKCRQAIRKVRKQQPDAVVAVIGCYAQLKAFDIMNIEGVSLVLGAEYKGRLVDEVMAYAAKQEESPSPFYHGTSPDHIEAIFPAYSAGEGDETRTRSFLKVQDGCDYRCSYCTVPLARGASRNLPIAQVVAQAHEIAAQGVKEIVLTGVNTGDFGKTTGESFFDLLKALGEVEGIERYRISSIEPNLLTNEMIDWLATQPKFMPHFHIPLQSGCDKVLKKMRRRYVTSFFADKVAYIRERIPYAFIGIDVIVGFTGETAEDFEETYLFLQQLAPSFLHVFPYSMRPNTPAVGFPKEERVSDAEKTLRASRLGALSDELHHSFCQANKGRTEYVLFEGKCKEGMMHGYTRNYIRVERPFEASLINQIVEVQI